MENIFRAEHRYLHMMSRVENLLEARNRFIEKNDEEHLLLAKELQRLDKQLCDLEQQIAQNSA